MGYTSGRKAALFKQMNVRTAGLWSKTPLPRGMWKQVSLKSYAPNTIHAFEHCHVLAAETKIVLKYPRVKPAAAWDARTEQDTSASCA